MTHILLLALVPFSKKEPGLLRGGADSTGVTGVARRAWDIFAVPNKGTFKINETITEGFSNVCTSKQLATTQVTNR